MIPSTRALFSYLEQNRYRDVCRLPLRHYPFSSKLALNELANIRNFTLNRSNLFSISFFPALYQKLISRRNIRMNDIFLLNKELGRDEVLDLLGYDILMMLQNSNFIEEETRGLRSNHRIVPYNGRLLLTSRFDRKAASLTFLSYDSLFFAQFVAERLRRLGKRQKKGLDVCCGMGIQAFTIGEFCESVTGIDLNKHAIVYAELNAQLNNFNSCSFVSGNFADIDAGPYDLVVSNPPFIYFEPDSGTPLDSDGGAPFGLKVTFDILDHLGRWLAKEGRAFILTRSPVINGQDHLFTELAKRLRTNRGCTYHYVSDSVAPLLPFEAALGISGYRHVILEISTGEGVHMKKYPFWYRRTHLF